ncbi:4-hydroxy-tetrahydrodipicolinate synthase [Sporomusa acidovorans]|uniref:4-hydroxy-tetrahydrodipicolinate synthase n=1 Tax=Sporomusa acidovorans (strain ATCC 49682 / DSM 3132 / Mol) TaxID=1123286 RepID=A0ABZ3J5A9_SPOA4|nr:4-hydroxy-tetrahydrodipicolinate synthase [Sporomusa acidovorans]OZC15699.1 putative 2-keto-3-deoxy-galactonate aldolase YagE [Sporomusa acidovorans DSM 3132]SDE89405.1 4-hydroxy-tetrahydrodipicolinate synthase [Sporomusa acidovorans]
MFQPKGIITPILTPLTQDEKFNEQEMRNQINRLIKAGVNGIFVLGTNGEFYALTQEEKIKIMEVAVAEVNGRVPVYAGTGCITTQATIKLSKIAKEIGVDALSVISPYFVSVSQDDLYRYFSSVAQAVDLPILLYNIPARTGSNIDYTTVKKLAVYENIVGIKDSSGNFDNTLKYIENTDSRLNIVAGNDSLIFWTLRAGGTAAIAGCSNVFPELMVSIYQLWAEGKMEEANEAQKKIRPFRNVMQMGNPNSVVKRAVELLGYPVGPAREPSNCNNPKIDSELLKVFELYK